LRLDGNGYETAHLLKDKWAMRQHLARGDAPTVAAQLLTGEDSLRSFGRAHGFPFIVKPTDLTASVGVCRVDGDDAVEEVWTRIEALRAGGGYRFFPFNGFMMEEYIDGIEYSVEAFSFDGRHVVVAVTEKHSLPSFVELGHALPARLDPAVEQDIVDCVTGFLDAVGLRRGPTHTEVKLSSAGPRVIESHNRVGGDRISELVDAAFGIDLDSYAIGWPFGLADELVERPRAHRAAATRFLTAQPGTVRAVKGVEEVRAHDGVIAVDVGVQEGEVVNALDSNWARIGQVLVTGPTTAAAVAICEQLVGKITVETG
jgi:biotin carboxylase